MADGGRTFFVLTLRGERGPVDRAGLRALLQQGEVSAEDQVRNAFGRPLGLVKEVLATRATASIRQPAPSPPPVDPARTGLPVVPIIIAVVVAAAVVIYLFAGSSGASPAPVLTPPVPVPAAPVATPSPVAVQQPAKPPSPPPRPAAGVSARVPLGAVYAHSEHQQASERLASAFDGDDKSKWLCFPKDRPADATCLVWVRMDPQSDRQRIRGYALTAANDFPQRDPATWRLLGLSGDGRETELDRRTGERFATRHQRRSFELRGLADYPSYRLEVLQLKDGDGCFQIAEIELLP